MNCGIIAVVMGIILSIIGNFLSTAQKHNRQNLSIIGWGLISQTNSTKLSDKSTVLLNWFCSGNFGIEAIIFHQIILNNVTNQLPSTHILYNMAP